jgi:hypothetical protein
MGHCVVVFNVVVVLCIVLYVVCVVLSVVSWSFMCVYCGFLPRFDVPFLCCCNFGCWEDFTYFVSLVLL